MILRIALGVLIAFGITGFVATIVHLTSAEEDRVNLGSISLIVFCLVLLQEEVAWWEPFAGVGLHYIFYRTYKTTP